MRAPDPRDPDPAVSPLRVSRPAAHVARLDLDHPPVNALSGALRAALFAALDALDADLEVRVVILTGRGRQFCGGDDLQEAAARLGGPTDALMEFGRLFDRIERLRPPVIAAVNGPCAGGGLELALSCDLRIAAPPARFVCAGVNIGLMASAHRLPRLIGLGRAKALLLTGRSLDPETAERWGLVTEIHPSEALEAAALALAERIASRAPLAVEAVKRHAGRAFDTPTAEGRTAYDRSLMDLAGTADHAAAIAAFLNRREPDFERR